MQVETYEIEPTTEDQELLEGGQASHLIESLGMEGQKKFLSNEGATRMNFRVMTREERKAIFYLFSASQEYKDYDKELVPVRVLEAIAKAEETGFFEKIEIRYHPTGEIVDPFVIGKRQEPVPGHSFTQDSYYLIARWGNALVPFADLVEQARTRWRDEIVEKLTRIKREVEAELEDFKTTPDYERLGQSPSFFKT